MPRVNRRPKKRNTGYTPEHLNVLRSGHDYFGVFADGKRGPRNAENRDMEAVREAWEIFRDEILHDWIRDKPQYPGYYGPGPGTRPWAWWKFDAPELRRRIDGKPHPFENPDRIAAIAEREIKFPGFAQTANKTYFGTSSCLFMRDDFGAEYETQQQYLERLDLLLPGERELLEDDKK